MRRLANGSTSLNQTAELPGFQGVFQRRRRQLGIFLNDADRQLTKSGNRSRQLSRGLKPNDGRNQFRQEYPAGFSVVDHHRGATKRLQGLDLTGRDRHTFRQQQLPPLAEYRLTEHDPGLAILNQDSSHRDSTYRGGRHRAFQRTGEGFRFYSALQSGAA